MSLFSAPPDLILKKKKNLSCSRFKKGGENTGGRLLAQVDFGSSDSSLNYGYQFDANDDLALWSIILWLCHIFQATVVLFTLLHLLTINSWKHFCSLYLNRSIPIFCSAILIFSAQYTMQYLSSPLHRQNTDELCICICMCLNVFVKCSLIHTIAGDPIQTLLNTTN